MFTMFSVQSESSKQGRHLGQKVFGDNSNLALHSQQNKSPQRSDCDCSKLKYESRESRNTGGRQRRANRDEEDQEVMTGCCVMLKQ